MNDYTRVKITRVEDKQPNRCCIEGTFLRNGKLETRRIWLPYQYFDGRQMPRSLNLDDVLLVELASKVREDGSLEASAWHRPE